MKLELSIFGVDSILSVTDVVVDIILHLLKFCNYEGVGNDFLVKPSIDESKYAFFVGGGGSYSEINQNVSIYLLYF